MAQSVWVDAQVSRMVAAWKNGEQQTADEILARHPEADSEAAVRLIYEEVCLRREAGQDVATTEVVQKYPRWRAELEPLLGCDRLLRPASSNVVAFPAIGEQLGDFRLLAELGRGAAGRTFLAAQPSLAERPVVLKVTARDHDEHLSLARLQHTHIVPLYSVQVFPDRGLRALCMPYLGGATLAQILADLARTPADRRAGRDLLLALDRLTAAAGGAGPAAIGGPFRQFLEQATYVKAICWVAACLADALQYAHDHGLVHMDVKPSNVLIAGDGQPMLLDFHLAGSPVQPGKVPTDRLGGTSGWTSPEQEAAMQAVIAGRAISRGVDGRSDLYSLGLLLYEALGGPTDNPAHPQLDQFNPRVSQGLVDIVQKCLEPDPSHRYAEGALLADDLRRHLNDLPLVGVPNQSVSERWRKWRRRRPDALTRGSARLTALTTIVALALLFWGYCRQQLREIENALAESQRLGQEHRHADAARSARRGLKLVEDAYFSESLKAPLEAQLRLASRAQQAEELHTLADQLRFWYGVAPEPNDATRVMATRLRKIWDERDRLAPPPGTVLEPEIERQLEVDLLELAVVWADLRLRLAPGEGQALTEARVDALAVLDQANAAYGPNLALARERRALARSLGRVDAGPVETATPRSAWEHYDLGRSYLRSNQIEAAAEEFRRSLELRPQDFWPNLYLGHCAYRLNRYEDALAAFASCVTLRPDSANGRVNRAMAYEKLDRVDDALRDYNRAIALDSRCVEAYLNRGTLLLRTSRPAEALADLRQALRFADDRETSARVRYNLALAHLASGNPARATAEARQAVALGSRDARAFLSRVQTRADTTMVAKNQGRPGDAPGGSPSGT